MYQDDGMPVAAPLLSCPTGLLHVLLYVAKRRVVNDIVNAGKVGSEAK